MTVLLLAMLSTAQAGLTDVTVCIKVQVDFEDGDVLDDGIVDPALSGDTWGTNGAKKARGFFVWAQRIGAGTRNSDWAIESGPSAGCATLTLIEGEQYDVGVSSTAYVNDHFVSVYANDTSGLSETVVAANITVPVGGGTFDRTLGATPKWKALATGALVAQKLDGVVAPHTFNIYTNPTTSPCPGDSCASDGVVYFDGSTTADYRFLIATLMGHAALQHHVGMVSANTQRYPGPGQPPDPEIGCSAGTSYATMASRQWQSLAITEGFARYVAAGTFNDESETDCGFVYHRLEDYDGSGTEETGVPEGISCEDGPSVNLDLPLSFVPTRDQHGYICSSYPIDYDGKAVVLDWLRFFWDFDTNPTAGQQDWDQGNVLSVLNSADPATWNAAGHAPTALGNGDDPYERVRYHVPGGYQPSWDTRAGVHGLNRGY